MSAFARVLSDVFERSAEARLSLDEEIVAIEAAQRGDQDATVALVYAYAPALRNAVSTFGAALDTDDARQAAVLGLVEAINKHDAKRGERLAGTISAHLTNALSSAAAAESQWAIPERMLQRFYGILRRAEGDVAKAVELAPSFTMSREAFLSILDAVRTTALEGATSPTSTGYEPTAEPLWGASAPIADVEDAVLVELAFRAVSDFEEDVCRLAYGFTEPDPQSDASIGETLGFGRLKIQRTRTKALGKMRDAIGLLDA